MYVFLCDCRHNGKQVYFTKYHTIPEIELKGTLANWSYILARE